MDIVDGQHVSCSSVGHVRQYRAQEHKRFCVRMFTRIVARRILGCLLIILRIGLRWCIETFSAKDILFS